METFKYKIELITPTIMGGADANHLDTDKIRTSEIKSIMRIAFRFVAGKYINHNKDGFKRLLEKEGEIFGSTKNKAKFKIFVENTENLRTKTIFLLPHKYISHDRKTYKEAVPKEAVIENQIFYLNFINYNPEKYPTDFYKALLKIAFLFGIGNRRNRFTGNMKLFNETLSLKDEVQIIDKICKDLFKIEPKSVDEPAFFSHTEKSDGRKNYRVFSLPLKTSFIRDGRLDFENILKTLYKEVIRKIENQKDIKEILGSANTRQSSFVNFSLYKQNGSYRVFIISAYYKNRFLNYQSWEKGIKEIEKLTRDAFELKKEGNKNA